MRYQRRSVGHGRDHLNEPFRRLYAAQRLITSDLTLATMVNRIVDSACEVIGVHSAALAVLAPTGAIEEFVHVGLDKATATHLGAATTEGELAALIGQHPSFVDAGSTSPTQHQPLTEGSIEYIRSGVAAGDEHCGDLYVAGPLAGSFTDNDRELIEALSRIAGTAVAHARSFDRERRSTQWLYASGEVARALLAGADVNMLNEIVARAVSASGADYGQLVIPTADGNIQVIATSGLGATELLNTVRDPTSSALGRIVIEGGTLRTPDIGTMLDERFPNKHSYGPSMIAPLTDAQGIRGSIMVARVTGSPLFAAHELDLFAAYAAQVALAMQFADARLDAERLQLLDIRHQTARELHDVVMQRLFATGVGLDRLVGQLHDGDQADQLRRYVNELDQTIDEIRERVFGTRGDAQAVQPTLSPFPRVPRDAVTAAAAPPLDTARAATQPVTSAGKLRRGRRRSDWTDGTGTQQS